MSDMAMVSEAMGELASPEMAESVRCQACDVMVSAVDGSVVGPVGPENVAFLQEYVADNGDSTGDAAAPLDAGGLPPLPI